MTQLFVYGTLKSDGPLNQYLAAPGARLLEPHVYTRSRTFKLINHNNLFPVAWCSTQGSMACFDRIKGEVWNVDNSTLALLDQIERGYTRQNVYIVDKYNTYQGSALMYVMQQAPDLVLNVPRVPLTGAAKFWNNATSRVEEIDDEYTGAIAAIHDYGIPGQIGMDDLEEEDEDSYDEDE